MQQLQGQAFSLYPEGLRHSPETTFLEPHNPLLMNSMHEMIDGLLSGKIAGVPLVQFLNRLAFLRAFFQGLTPEGSA